VDRVQYRELIGQLLEDSPITSQSVIKEVRELLAVGEEGLAFDTLCSWIYEDGLPITNEYHARLADVAGGVASAELVGRLRELIIGAHHGDS